MQGTSGYCYQAYSQDTRSNLLIVLFLVQLAKKIPFEDPNVLNMARGAYVLSNLVILGIYMYVKMYGWVRACRCAKYYAIQLPPASYLQWDPGIYLLLATF